MNSAAYKARELVKAVVAPYVRPGDRISRQKHLSFEILRADELPSGWSKIERAWKGRAGPPTYHALHEQAEKLGLLKDNSAHIARLRTTREMLRDKDGEFYREQIEAIDWAVSHLSPGTRTR